MPRQPTTAAPAHVPTADGVGAPWQAEGVSVESRTVAPLVLITGPETVLVERALADRTQALRERDPQVEIIRLSAPTYAAGDLALHASPSLFAGSKAIVVRDLAEASDELLTDLASLLAKADPELTLVVVHGGGNRGKRVLDELRRQGAEVVSAAAIKSDRDKAEFVSGEFGRARRRVTADAVQALVEAVGQDVTELASACAQLIADTDGTVDADIVQRYHGGKVEATGFRVADAALAGDAGQSLRLLRHALTSGVDPVPIVAVLASQLRQLVKVAAAGRGRAGDLARDLQMAPWQVERAWRTLRGWDAAGLGRSIQAVAAADQDVKGAGRDPVYAVERAILTIVAERGGAERY